MRLPDFTLLRRLLFRRLLLGALLLSPLVANAASFNCKLARTNREQAVCADPSLSKLDSDLGAAYKSGRTRLSPASAALIQGDQREWLHWLDAVCPAKNPSANSVADCLKEHYNTRLDQLTKGLQSIDGSTFFPRAHFVVVPASAAEKAQDHSDNDPGFGYGEFAWPQIDNPSEPQAAWNTAVSAAAEKIEGTAPKGKAASLDAAVDANGYVYGYYTLSAANTRLIDVDLGISTYGWGAAHPNTAVVSFLWWLDQRRPLVAADIFRPASHWQTRLIAPTIEKLGDEGLWESAPLHKAVAAAIPRTDAWSVSAHGLTITFGQYEVGPYSSGMPSVNFSWAELQPMLNPALSPRTLPAATPLPK